MSITPRLVPVGKRQFTELEIVAFADLATRPVLAGELLLCYISTVANLVFPASDLSAWVLMPINVNQSIIVQEADGSPLTTNPSKFIFPNGSVAVVGSEVTITFAGAFSSPARTIISRAATQSGAGNSNITLSWDTEEEDNLSNMWVIGTPSRFKNNSGGSKKYKVLATISMGMTIPGTLPTNNVAYFVMVIKKNGTTDMLYYQFFIPYASFSYNTTHQFEFSITLANNDYFEMILQCNLLIGDTVILNPNIDAKYHRIEIYET